VKKVLPTRILRVIPPRIGAGTKDIAFRAYIVSRMTDILSREAAGDGRA
jgi:hypothetical protein